MGWGAGCDAFRASTGYPGICYALQDLGQSFLLCRSFSNGPLCSLLPGVGSPFLQENVPQAHLPSGAHSALVTMSFVGDGSGERAPLLSPRGAGNLGPSVFRTCALRSSGLHISPPPDTGVIPSLLHQRILNLKLFFLQYTLGATALRSAIFAGSQTALIQTWRK